RASVLGVHFGGCDVQLSAHADADAEVCLQGAQQPEPSHIRAKSKQNTRIRKSEPLEVKMMAKFVAEGAHERAEGSDFLPHRRPHPHADQHGLRIVVAEKFTRPVFADSQRSGREHADTACWCSVELRGGCQKLCTS